MRMAGVYDYREFIAWQRANDVRVLVGGLTTRRGFDDHLWLRSQLRRAANASCTNIAEGFLRFYPCEFARYLQIAKGSLGEVVEHMSDVIGLGLASNEEGVEIIRLAKRALKATRRLILYLESLPPDQAHDYRRRGQKRRANDRRSA